ncbi:MAG: tetratricopeptide repeat protein [Candidatus Cloacimonetes bacterium]|nr:tetratricopeptide repeat protein [Candidatus Cloacimonadota bacterium]
MKLMQNELIEFTDEQNLEVLGNGKDITSKVRSLRRLIQRGLLPKPKWEGGKFPAFWENDLEIKERIIWIDEKRKEGLSYRQMKEESESEKTPHPEGLIAEDLISTIDNLLQIDYDNSKVLFIKAQMLNILGKREEVLEILKKLEANCKDNKEFLFIVYEKMAHIYHNFDDKENELKTCQKLISLAEEMGDNEKLGAAYCDMGNCLRDSEMERAFDYFQRSVELLEGSNLLGDAYGSMYWIQQKKRNFSKAEEYLKKSIEIFIKSNNKQKECVSKANLGLLYYMSNRMSEALKLMQEAYHAFSQLHDLDGEAATIGNIGKIYMQRGLFPKAIEHFRQAYHIASKIKNPRAQKVWLEKMSKVYKEMGNLKKSEFFLKESKKIEEPSETKTEMKKSIPIRYEFGRI